MAPVDGRHRRGGGRDGDRHRVQDGRQAEAAPEAIVLLLLAAFAAAWLRLPLPLIVLALAPLSIAASLWRAGLILRSETAR